jgi:hypothetical protein
MLTLEESPLDTVMCSILKWTTSVTQTRHAATEQATRETMRTTIVTDPSEFHRMMDEEHAQVGATPPTTEPPPEVVWSDRTYRLWRKPERPPKNAWRAKKRERAAQRRRRWRAQNPGT